MKHLFKLSGALLLDQFVGCFAGWMMILCVSVIFKKSMLGHLVALIFCFGFYAYTCYNSSFKSGFHDSHRAIRDTAYKGYLYKGAISGFIAAIPLLIFYFVCLFSKLDILKFYYMTVNMYWTWPMSNLFPSNALLIMGLTFVPMILIPWLGYIAGYKNFLFTDLFMSLYQKSSK